MYFQLSIASVRFSYYIVLAQVNSEFYYVRPTKAAITLFTRMVHKVIHAHPNATDTLFFSMLSKMNSSQQIRAKFLPDDMFPNGRVYFEVGNRMFAGDKRCPTCVIIHNNWIEGEPAKKYRFREHLLWNVDKYRYYSFARRKYVTYDNPVDFGANLTFKKEDSALRSAFAIAHLLSRTLILPRFHCYKCWRDCDKTKSYNASSTPYCYAGVFYRIATLDLHLPYRESQFLRHTMVPNQVKISMSPIIEIIPGDNSSVTLRRNVSDTFIAKDGSGASKEEIRQWFDKYDEVAVLRFRSLYGAFTRFNTLGSFEGRLKRALVPADYRQTR